LAEEPQGTIPDLWRAFDDIKSLRAYAAGAGLFEEDSPAVGIFLIESGRVGIRVSTEDGTWRRLATAGRGTMLGLSEAISGASYKVSAHAVGRADVFFVPREALMEFLTAHPRICMEIVRVLSEDLHSLYHQFRNLDTGRARRRAANGRFC